MLKLLGGGVLGRGAGHEGGALTNGTSALIKEVPGSSLSPPTLRGHSEKSAT